MDTKIISSETPDWTREKKAFFAWDPSRALLASIRSYQATLAKDSLIHALLRRIAVMRHRFWSVVTGADIPINTEIGGGLLLPHPNGVVIHCDAKIGPNCLIFQQVTIGIMDGGKAPKIGGHVDIGAGAKILGAVTLGNHTKIGANAVVLKDVPDNCSAVGVPAKII
jgi:serine O-acetyltransferase